MLQFGRAFLLQNHLPATKERSMSYNVFTGFHQKPALGKCYKTYLFDYRKKSNERLKAPVTILCPDEDL